MQPPLRERRVPHAGLSMVELLVSMIIVTIVGTMLVAGWISLQRSFAFAQAKNTARATARDALERMSSEIRGAQPTAVSITPFNFVQPSGIAAMPTVGGPYACVFYSAYNYSPAGPTDTPRSDGTGTAKLRLTALWLDASGSAAQKTLYWQRDVDNNGLDANDRKIILARDVVNTAAGVNKNIFTYFFRDETTGVYSQSNSLTSTSVATLVSVQIELVVDANLSRTPSYVDVKTTLRPRNPGAN